MCILTVRTGQHVQQRNPLHGGPDAFSDQEVQSETRVKKGHFPAEFLWAFNTLTCALNPLKLTTEFFFIKRNVLCRARVAWNKLLESLG